MERRAWRGLLPLLAVHTASEYYRLDRKPPVTAALLGANTLIYLRPAFLRSIIPSINDVWFNAHLIFKYKDLKRFFLSPFYHMGESHLVYNMLSLLWKGIQLETSMGSIEFASMVAALLAMSQGMTLVLSKSLLLLFDYEKAYYSEYAVGFSGVLFAMKVVLNAQSDDYTFVHGILVPSRHAAWAELILIQLFVPGVSFLGHLGGILAGLLYLQLKRSYSGQNPLRSIVKSVLGLFRWPLRLFQGLCRPRRYSGRGAVGRGQIGGNVWRCPACTFDNSGLLSVCEMCGTGRDGSDFTSNLQGYPSLDELRRRRVERFSR